MSSATTTTTATALVLLILLISPNRYGCQTIDYPMSLQITLILENEQSVLIRRFANEVLTPLAKQILICEEQSFVNSSEVVSTLHGDWQAKDEKQLPSINCRKLIETRHLRLHLNMSLKEVCSKQHRHPTGTDPLEITVDLCGLHAPPPNRNLTLRLDYHQMNATKLSFPSWTEALRRVTSLVEKAVTDMRRHCPVRLTERECGYDEDFRCRRELVYEVNNHRRSDLCVQSFERQAECNLSICEERCSRAKFEWTACNVSCGTGWVRQRLVDGQEGKFDDCPKVRNPTEQMCVERPCFDLGMTAMMIGIAGVLMVAVCACLLLVHLLKRYRNNDTDRGRRSIQRKVAFLNRINGRNTSSSNSGADGRKQRPGKIGASRDPVATNAAAAAALMADPNINAILLGMATSSDLEPEMSQSTTNKQQVNVPSISLGSVLLEVKAKTVVAPPPNGDLGSRHSEARTAKTAEVSGAVSAGSGRTSTAIIEASAKSGGSMKTANSGYSSVKLVCKTAGKSAKALKQIAKK